MRENKFDNTMERVDSHSLKGWMSRSGISTVFNGVKTGV